MPPLSFMTVASAAQGAALAPRRRASPLSALAAPRATRRRRRDAAASFTATCPLAGYTAILWPLCPPLPCSSVQYDAAAPSPCHASDKGCKRKDRSKPRDEPGRSSERLTGSSAIHKHQRVRTRSTRSAATGKSVPPRGGPKGHSRQVVDFHTNARYTSSREEAPRRG